MARNEKYYRITFMSVIISTIYLSLIVVVQAGGIRPPHRSIECSKNSEVVDIVETRSLRWETYFFEGVDGDFIQFNEKTLYRKPIAISKFEYADACLSIIKGKSHTEKPIRKQLCDVIQFLERRNALDEDDIYQLEDYSFSKGSLDTKFNAYALKSALSCLYR